MSDRDLTTFLMGVCGLIVDPLRGIFRKPSQLHKF